MNSPTTRILILSEDKYLSTSYFKHVKEFNGEKNDIQIIDVIGGCTIDKVLEKFKKLKLNFDLSEIDYVVYYFDCDVLYKEYDQLKNVLEEFNSNSKLENLEEFVKGINDIFEVGLAKKQTQKLYLLPVNHCMEYYLSAHVFDSLSDLHLSLEKTCETCTKSCKTKKYICNKDCYHRNINTNNRTPFSNKYSTDYYSRNINIPHKSVYSELNSELKSVLNISRFDDLSDYNTLIDNIKNSDFHDRFSTVQLFVEDLLK